jgi:hypothetical protein
VGTGPLRTPTVTGSASPVARRADAGVDVARAAMSAGSDRRAVGRGHAAEASVGAAIDTVTASSGTAHAGPWTVVASGSGAWTGGLAGTRRATAVSGTI